MKFIRPTRITDAEFVSSTVLEDDQLPWDSGLLYEIGDKVIRTETHRIYERQVAGVTATPPEDDQANWLDIAPTNRWAMFDEKVGTVTTASESITVALEPGLINSLGLLGVSAASVTVTLEVDAETVYSATLDLTDNSSVGNWYEYFYEPRYEQDTVVLTDLLDAALLDIPAYGEGVLTVTLSRPGGSVACGMLVVGMVATVGKTLYAPSVEIRDYSRKERDDFGNFVVVERAYSKLIVAPVEVSRGRVDAVAKELPRYRARAVLWIGAEDYGALVAYGFLARWKIIIETPTSSVLEVEIEGMT